jgi:hypothetical protein
LLIACHILPGASTLATPSHRPPDSTKSPTVVAIRETRARLTAVSLRRLREGLFKLELQIVEDMVTSGLNRAKVRALSHCARALEGAGRAAGDGARAVPRKS